MTGNDWLKIVWLPLLVTIVGGLVLAGILAIFSETVRRRFWRPIGHGLRWLTTLRVTTTGLMNARLDQANDDIQEQQKQTADLVLQAAKASELASVRIAALQDQLELSKSAAKDQVVEVVESNTRLVETAREMGRVEGRAEAEADIAAQRAAPALKPVWRVIELKSSGEYELRDTQDVRGLRNVSIDASSTAFVFTAATQANRPFREAVRFQGHRTHAGSLLGINFTVRWQDGNGDHREQTVHLDREPLAPFAHGAVVKREPGEELGGLRF